MTPELLLVTEEQGVVTAVINRPAALNALNSQFFRELNGLLERAETDAAWRVLILTGAGKAFVAGADIAEMAAMDPPQALAFSQAGQRALLRLENLPIPVIAAVNGFALGGGCELALACDICIASRTARFAQPEVGLGLVPGYAGTQRLPRRIGSANALAMLLSGDMIGAEEALRIGLAQKICEPDQLLDETRALALRIAARGPQAVRETKRLVRAGLGQEFAAACAGESAGFAARFGFAEAREGMRAFLEKRPPNWAAPVAKT